MRCGRHPPTPAFRDLTGPPPASSARPPHMPLMLPWLVRAHLRSPFRGKTRLTHALAARAPALQAVPVDIAGARPLYLDLRDVTNHGLFRDSPHRDVPWERTTVAAFRQVVRPGDVAFDVGANRGLHAVVLAALVGPAGQVVCVEPNPALRPCLERTVADTPWMRLLPVALADADGEATLFVGSNHETSSLGDWLTPRYREHPRSVPTPVRRLDDLVARGEVPRPDVIKIDVEGAELRAFRGARAVLDREEAPIILYEQNVWAAPVAAGAPASASTDFLLALERPRYRCYFVWDWGLVTRVQPGQVVHGNLVAVPAARRDRWPALADADLTELQGAPA